MTHPVTFHARFHLKLSPQKSKVYSELHSMIKYAISISTVKHLLNDINLYMILKYFIP